MTFASRFAALRPAETALRDPHTALTWAEVDDALRPAVNALLSLDLGPGRRVAVLAENSATTVLAYAATTLAGISAVPVNIHLTAPEIAYILADSDAGAVLVDDRTAAVGAAAALDVGVAVLDWRSLAGDTAEPPTDARPLPTLVYTSGTTGRPKGVDLPPTSFVGGVDVAEHVARLAGGPMTEHGRHLVVGPMYHSGPLTSTRLFLGGTPLTVLGRFDAEAVLEAVQRDAIASTIMVPTHFRRLLALPAATRDRYDVSSLRYVLQVGAACPVEVKRAMIDWWGPVVWESYGASEVGTTCLISAAEWLDHPGSVGRAIPPFEVVVLGEDDEPVRPGVEGRLYFRDTTGHGVVYHRDAGGSGLVFTLGEIGYVDADGFVFITDRFSDMVVSGGVNIYPAESEQVLARHPAVADVACVGVPDPEMGEQLLALVVPVDADAPPAEADLVDHCRHHLSHYKCPRQARIVASLGRSAMGKINKKALRSRYAAMVQS